MTTPQWVLLDTSVIIDLDQLDLGDLATATALISAVTVAELGYGLDVDDPVKRTARTERYYAILDKFDILPFGLGAAKQYALLASLVRRAGRNPRPRRMDLQIAATAAACSVPLLTRNAKDFVGLDQVIDVLAI